MKKITVTEENYKEILNKIQEITNKYKMLMLYQVFDENMKEQKQYRNIPMGFTRTWQPSKKKDSYRRAFKWFKRSSFVETTEHRFKIKSETEPESFDAKLYEKMKSLIHLDMNASSAMVLSAGDKIRFLPLNLGFITYTDDDYTRFANPLTIYRHTFVIDWSNRIENLEAERSIRIAEWEDDERLYAQMEMESLEYDDPYQCQEEDWLQEELFADDYYSDYGMEAERAYLMGEETE